MPGCPRMERVFRHSPPGEILKGWLVQLPITTWSTGMESICGWLTVGAAGRQRLQLIQLDGDIAVIEAPGSACSFIQVLSGLIGRRSLPGRWMVAPLRPCW